MAEPKSKLELLATAVQVVSVIIGVAISVLSFKATQDLQTAKPFLALRQSLYMEALQAAEVLANPQVHTEEEIAKSRKRFRQLYIGELSMVEAKEVEAKMVALAREIDPELLNMNEAQKATYNLAHALRDSFVDKWKIRD